MVYSTHRTIEANTRLHRQGAAMAASLELGPTHSSNLALHVDGWPQQNETPAALPRRPAFMAAALGPIASNHSTAAPSPDPMLYMQGQRTFAAEILPTRKRLCPGASPPPEENLHAPKRPAYGQQGQQGHCGVRITDLLNPAAPPALAAAHRMTLPTVLARTQSDDAKHLHRQLAEARQKPVLPQQQQQQQPVAHLARTATAPVETDASCAKGLVREALELDKLYDITCVIIESIWPNHSLSQRTQLCSLRCFVAETHRQSLLGSDVLELCMFYLLRAKSIIQAKQRAARQKEEQEQEQQQQLQRAQPMIVSVGSAADASTPPLSPNNNHAMTAAVSASSFVRKLPSPTSEDTPMGSSDTLVQGGAAYSITPITPASAKSTVQAAIAPCNKQQILRSGMVTHVGPTDAKSNLQNPLVRPLAGSTASLPNSYRNFMIPTAAANSDGSGTQLQSPEEKPLSEAASAATAPAKKQKPDVTKCGRRMFVAALISASKFFHDQIYKNSSWTKVTKLPVAQISDMERAFLKMIDYRLYVDSNTYEKFHRLLARSGMRNGRLMVCDPNLAASSSSSSSVPSTAATSPTSPLSLPGSGNSQAAGGSNGNGNGNGNGYVSSSSRPLSPATATATATAANGYLAANGGDASLSATAIATAAGPITPCTPSSVAGMSVSSTPTIHNSTVKFHGTNGFRRILSSDGGKEAAVQMHGQVVDMLRIQQQRQQQQQSHGRHSYLQQSSINYSILQKD